MNPDPIPAIERKFRLRIRQKELFLRALRGCHFLGAEPTETQRREVEENERLEFLGDAVLGFLISEELFHRFQEEPVGVLAASKAALVSGSSLAQKAREISLTALANFQESDLPEREQEILADLLEAFIGALYLDQGLQKTHHILSRMFEKDILETILGKGQRDLKGVLQEITLREFHQLPKYVTEPADGRQFRSEVWVQNQKIGEGRGGTKREAEIQAAHQSLASANSWFRTLRKERT